MGNDLLSKISLCTIIVVKQGDEIHLRSVCLFRPVGEKFIEWAIYFGQLVMGYTLTRVDVRSSLAQGYKHITPNGAFALTCF
jgi:hypothetical protein